MMDNTIKIGMAEQFLIEFGELSIKANFKPLRNPEQLP